MGIRPLRDFDSQTQISIGLLTVWALSTFKLEYTYYVSFFVWMILSNNTSWFNSPVLVWLINHINVNIQNAVIFN